MKYLTSIQIVIYAILLCSCGGGGSSSVEPVEGDFLSIAKNENASQDQKDTVEFLMRISGQDDIDNAYEWLKLKTFLTIRGDVVKDLSPLKGLNRLEDLSIDFYENGVDLAPLGDLPNLSEVSFSYTNLSKVKNISALKKLKHVIVNRELPGNGQELKFLDEALSLEDIYCSGSDVEVPLDLSPLANLINLKKLTLNNNEIIDISPLADLSNLKELNLNDNNIVDISPLYSLTKLLHLYLNNNAIETIEGLDALSSLRSLDLSAYNISNFSIIHSFHSVTSLTVSDCGIQDLDWVDGLPTNLDYLNVSNNNISDISPVSGLYNLKILDISSNKITDISILPKLKYLRLVELSFNQIEDFSAFDDSDITIWGEDSQFIDGY